MATIYREFEVAVPLAFAWDAVRAFGEVHEKLARDFVTQTTLAGDIRTITFANGWSAQERLIAMDDELHRLVYSAMGDKIQHHNAAMHLSAKTEITTVIRWSTDILPDALQTFITPMMDAAVAAVRVTLEHRYVRENKQ